MDPARGAAESRDSRFDELYAEAKSTLGYGANNLRSVTERYREAYRDVLGRWHRLRDELDVSDRAPLAQSKGTDPAAAACFKEVPLTDTTGGKVTESSPLAQMRAFRIVCP